MIDVVLPLFISFPSLIVFRVLLILFAHKGGFNNQSSAIWIYQGEKVLSLQLSHASQDNSYVESPCVRVVRENSCSQSFCCEFARFENQTMKIVIVSLKACLRHLWEYRE